MVWRDFRASDHLYGLALEYCEMRLVQHWSLGSFQWSSICLARSAVERGGRWPPAGTESSRATVTPARAVGRRARDGDVAGIQAVLVTP